MFKRFSILLSLVLTLFLVVTACTQAPAPTVTVTSSPTPTATAHPEVRVDMMGGTFGVPSYVITTAASDLMKKYHPWLRGTTAETPGFIYNQQALEESPELWGKTIIGNNLAQDYLARNGLAPFTTRIVGMRQLVTYLISWYAIATFDPNIKTVNDLVGKKLALGSKAQIAWAIVPDYFLRDGLGILDQIDVQYVSPANGVRALLDGLVDAAIVGLVGNPATNNWTWQDADQELIGAGKRFNYISWGKENTENVIKKTGMPLPGSVIPAGTLEYQTEDLFGWSMLSGHWVKDVFPEDIAYEFTKLHLDHYDKFAEYHALGNAYTPEYLAFGITKSKAHPGALRAFEEAGITLPE